MGALGAKIVECVLAAFVVHSKLCEDVVLFRFAKGIGIRLLRGFGCSGFGVRVRCVRVLFWRGFRILFSLVSLVSLVFFSGPACWRRYCSCSPLFLGQHFVMDEDAERNANALRQVLKEKCPDVQGIITNDNINKLVNEGFITAVVLAAATKDQNLIPHTRKT